MDIKVNIQAPELAEALNNLAGALKGATSLPTTAPKQAKPKKEETKKEEVPVEEKPVKEEKATEPEPAPEKTTVTEIEDADLRAAAAAKAKEGKKDEVKALLTEFDVKNVSAIPQEKRADFLAKLEAL